MKKELGDAAGTQHVGDVDFGPGVADGGVEERGLAGTVCDDVVAPHVAVGEAGAGVGDELRKPRAEPFDAGAIGGVERGFRARLAEVAQDPVPGEEAVPVRIPRVALREEPEPAVLVPAEAVVRGGGVHACGDAARGLPELVGVRQLGVEGFEHDRARAGREHARGRQAAQPGEDFQAGGLGGEHVRAVPGGCLDDDFLAVIELAQPDGIGEPAGQAADAPGAAAVGQEIRRPSIAAHLRPFAFVA